MTAGGDGRIREDFYFPANFEKKHQPVKIALSKIGETCIIGYIKPREERGNEEVSRRIQDIYQPW